MTIVDAEQLGGAMLERLAELFEEEGNGRTRVRSRRAAWLHGVTPEASTAACQGSSNALHFTRRGSGTELASSTDIPARGSPALLCARLAVALGQGGLLWLLVNASQARSWPADYPANYLRPAFHRRVVLVNRGGGWDLGNLAAPHVNRVARLRDGAGHCRGIERRLAEREVRHRAGHFRSRWRRHRYRGIGSGVVHRARAGGGGRCRAPTARVVSDLFRHRLEASGPVSLVGRLPWRVLGRAAAWRRIVPRDRCRSYPQPDHAALVCDPSEHGRLRSRASRHRCSGRPGERPAEPAARSLVVVLLPVATVLVIGFIAALPFTGLAPLLAHESRVPEIVLSRGDGVGGADQRDLSGR